MEPSLSIGDNFRKCSGPFLQNLTDSPVALIIDGEPHPIVCLRAVFILKGSMPRSRWQCCSPCLCQLVEEVSSSIIDILQVNRIARFRNLQSPLNESFKRGWGVSVAVGVSPTEVVSIMSQDMEVDLHKCYGRIVKTTL